MVSTYTCKQRTRRWPMVLWYNMLDVTRIHKLHVTTPEVHEWHMQRTPPVHQRAGSGVSHATHEEVLGEHTPYSKSFQNGKMWDHKTKPRHHTATGHQAGRPREEKEVCNLHNFQGQKSQQLVFPVHQACV